MGIASLVIGIVAVIMSMIPCVGWLALLPAVVGLVLGILEFNKKKKAEAPKGMSLAGIVLNIVALVFIVVWMAVMARAGSALEKGLKEYGEEYGQALQESVETFERVVEESRQQQEEVLKQQAEQVE